MTQTHWRKKTGTGREYRVDESQELLDTGKVVLVGEISAKAEITTTTKGVCPRCNVTHTLVHFTEPLYNDAGVGVFRCVCGEVKEYESHNLDGLAYDPQVLTLLSYKED